MIIDQIFEGIEKGRALYESVRGSVSVKKETSGNDELFLGDNIEYMKRLMERGYDSDFSLIYIDPPFFTRSSFNASVRVTGSDGTVHRIHHLAYDDMFDRSLEYYIENMTARLLMMKDLLSDTGLMWIHLDWHSSHYIKLVLDEIMGSDNFVNEIIWCYKSGGSGKRHFARKHDTILVYSKSKGYYIDIPSEKSYNRGCKAYRFKGVKEYQDDNGWYTMVNMKDVWNIDMVGRTSAERTGYATQKPMELAERIIKASTKEGDLVGDFFSGSGSVLEASHALGRRFMGCDSEELAVSMSRKRLKQAGADFIFLREEENSPKSGSVDLHITGRDKLTDGRYLYNLKLSEFKPEIDIGSIKLNDRQYVYEAVESDPLQFVDYIMADTDFDGKFQCRYIFDPRTEDIRFVSDGSHELIVVDVFGREYTAEVN